MATHTQTHTRTRSMCEAAQINCSCYENEKKCYICDLFIISAFINSTLSSNLCAYNPRVHAQTTQTII